VAVQYDLGHDDRPILSIVAFGYIDEMPASTPKPPYFQYSLRSLLLLTLFVAVMCSIGACTHWLVPVVIASTILIGGIAGRIVAGTRLGFWQGAVYGLQFLCWAGFACLFVPCLWEPFMLVLLGKPSWQLIVLLGLAVLIGGIVGGSTVRPRPR